MKRHKILHRVIAVLLMLTMIMNSNVVLNAMATEAQTEAAEGSSEAKQTEETAVKYELTEAETPVTEETAGPEETAMPPAVLDGTVRYPDGTGMAGIIIKLFDKAQYIYDDPDTEVREDEQNHPVYETITGKDGSYRIDELEPIEYRIEYVNENPDLELSPYQLVPVKTAAYEIIAGTDRCLAYIDTIKIEDQETVDITLKEAERQTEEMTEVQTEPETETEMAGAGAEETTETPQTEEAESKPLTIAELQDVEDDVAMAAVEKSDSSKKAKASGSNWRFNAIYVGEKDKRSVLKTGDFNLKYQMEFNTSTDLNPGELEIRIKYALLEYRNGSKINPADIAVPKGTMEAPKVSSNPLNYYLDDEEIVFFNYTAIEAGTNIAFQVLYKNLKIMEIKDETSWSLEPAVTVKKESVKAEPLTGRVDSQVSLSGVTKKPYKQPGRSYTPGLYTEKQVRSFLNSDIPEPYKSNFEDYKYVVWEIQVKGSATQHWDLYLKDTSAVNGQPGELVGYSGGRNGGVISGGTYDQYSQIVKNSNSGSVSQLIYAVTAYPVSTGIKAGSVTENNIDVILHPYDDIDPDQQKSANITWPYEDYNWRYDGDQFSFRKSAGSAGGGDAITYPGWLDVYEIASRNQEASGEIDFRVSSTYRGYDNVMHTSGPELGQIKEGNSYKMITSDEAVYAYPNQDSSGKVLLDGSDYYFSAVNISQRDSGYDIWEDSPAQPDKAGDLIVYAWYQDSTDWEKAAVVPWNENGVMDYAFTPEQIARGPWRVKAEHETVNYSTSCSINLRIMIRHDSAKIRALLDNNADLSSLTIQNIAGGYGKGRSESGGQSGFHEYKVDDSAVVHLTRSGRRAAAYKAGTATNNPASERVNVKYALAAHDGYLIYSRDAANYLKTNGVKSPGRNAVVFYDLLPYGVRFDASVPIVAGRVTNTQPTGIIKPGSWDTSQVTATVDPNTDVITNYKNTGRTMVVIHLTYEGIDSAAYRDGMWMEGFGVSFGAYYSWKDLDIVNDAPNISAFMPEVGDHEPLLGENGEVFRDNGDVPSGYREDYKYFGANINGDPTDDDIPRVLYAKTAVNEDVAIYSKSEISKLVRADSDKYGPYVKSTEVEKGGNYTYDITVSSASGVLENIVVYDILEYAPQHRADDETEDFESDWWYGEFKGVTTTALELLGIKPVIYYHADRETARIETDSSKDPVEVLTPANGWIKAEDWTLDLKDVQAVAADLTWSTTAGQKFQLESMKNISFQINMTAPETVAESKVYAYNNASFYSYDTFSHSTNLESSKAVKVKMTERGDLEVVKEFDGDIPDSVKAWSFLFRAYSNEGADKVVYANKKYELYKRGVDGDWVKQGGLYATDAQGEFYLEANEKAVFYDSLKAGELVIEEEQNPFWEVEIDQQGSGNNRTLIFKNKYRSVLYVQKKLAGVPTDKAETVKDAEFTFQLLIGGEPAGDTDFLYVDRPRTDGGVPNILGGGKTAANGTFTIKPGENIAFSQEPLVEYTIRETAGYGQGTDWLCEKPEISGTLPATGKVEAITNNYRWKSLYLKKAISNQDYRYTSQEFTFQIQDQNGAPLTTENRYAVISEGYVESEGNLNADGSFTGAIAGKTVRIEGLEAKATYRVYEADSGQDYQPINGLVEVTMPLNGDFAEVTVTNDYLMRTLSVSKEVFYDPEDYDLETQEGLEAFDEMKQKEFRMIAEINGQPLADHPYELKEGGTVIDSSLKTGADGSFVLRHGQTAALVNAGRKGDSYVVTELPDPDNEYFQITPADNQPYRGLLGEEPEVKFVNASAEGGNQLIIGKEYVPSEDDPEESNEWLVESTKWDASYSEKLAVTLTLEIRDGDRSFIWPEEDTRVTVIDQIQDTTEKVTWKAGSPL